MLATHIRTDGDDLGSMLAIAHVLEKTGKQFALAAAGGVPRSLQFLPMQEQVKEDIPAAGDAGGSESGSDEYDGIILFGCCDPARTHIPRIMQSNLPILNFDHHPDNSNFGETNVVDTQKSSVAELVFDFLKFLGTEISEQMATCLLTGIIHDTGSFMHPNTTAETLKAGGELLKFGARPEKPLNFIYKKDLSAFRAWGKALENAKIDRAKKMALCILSEEDLSGLEIRQGTFEGFVDILNTIPGTDFSMFVRQDGELIKGSVRACEGKGVDVSSIAQLFGGGGHKLASGFALKGRLNKKPNGYCEVLAG